MNFFWAIFLGLVQGLTEFFPVSSSAHLALLPKIFGLPDPGLDFDIALHAGTFMAILLAFRTEWLKLVKAFFNKKPSFEKTFVWFLIITSVPGAVFGVLLEKKAEGIFRSPLLIAAALALFGAVLWRADKRIEKRKRIEDLSIKDALVIGFSQAIAIIPGVSRSGATISAGRLLGLSREVAVKYSFMAALPIILGAAAFGLRHVPVDDMLSAGWVGGFLAALGSSLWAMKFLLSWVRTRVLDIFVVYRVALAIVVLIIIIAGK
jgi:undecaprenyl-diphosphatase